MLTPSELRDRGKAILVDAAKMPVGPEPPAWVLFYIGTLCEQVAELREKTEDRIEAWPRSNQSEDAVLAAKTPWCPLDIGVGTISKPSPRILKASEITEPGWYACRYHGKKAHWNRVYHFANPQDAPPVQDAEYYGPIDLPE